MLGLKNRVGFFGFVLGLGTLQAYGAVETLESLAMPEVANPTGLSPEVARPAAVLPQQEQKTSLAPVAPPATVPAVAAPEAVAPSPTKSELLRRQRMREELRNEDSLQMRLEELRLADEKKREEHIQSFGTPAPAPVVDRIVEKVVVTQAAPIEAESLEAKSKKDEETTYGTFGFQLRGGMNNMLIDETYFKANGRFALGVGLDIPVADVLGLELGFQYSETGIGMSPNNPWLLGYNTMFNNNNAAAYSGLWESKVYSQNFIDALFKLLPLGQQSKFRPYVGAGLGYSLGYLNYNRRMVDYLRSINFQGLTTDYQTQSMIGSVAVGFDYRASKQIVVGVSGKFSRVLTFTENYPFNNFAFLPWGMNGTPFIPNNGWDGDKVTAGTSLARSSFFTIMGTLSFYF